MRSDDTRPRIGGAMDYAALATRNRPKDADSMRVAVHELRSRGYGDLAIAQATGLSIEAVRRFTGP
jgi:hypothetical protein